MRQTNAGLSIVQIGM